MLTWLLSSGARLEGNLTSIICYFLSRYLHISPEEIETGSKMVTLTASNFYMDASSTGNYKKLHSW